MKEKKNKGFLRFTHTLSYSLSGIKSAWKFEESFRQEMILFIILTPVACLIGVEMIDFIVLIGSLWFLLIVELINSSIEAVVDRVGLEYNHLSKRAKDIGSAAVMLAIILTIFIWFVVIYYRHIT
ncbi:diacylglycerol kinase [Lentisphaera marina]|uniref:diacylglycerol kinase n=1 Tax=Lentisphaera marina TaxID=1111041 RepID=UPI0023655C76|nr:diacylglycerol kinase [Lentisphaera marina]MDD7987302.1 diacylglycerol kinase [Lentisphaera marina]